MEEIAVWFASLPWLLQILGAFATVMALSKVLGLLWDFLEGLFGSDYDGCNRRRK